MMMELKKLFTPVSSMDADEAQEYMAKHREGDYLILDVRQPGEYEEAHLPGAQAPASAGAGRHLSGTGPGKTHHRALRHGRPQPGGGPDALRLGVQGGL